MLHPTFAYNTSCGWAQLGMLDRAARRLERALELGFDEHDRLRHDPGLAPLPEHPAWATLVGDAPAEQAD